MISVTLDDVMGDDLKVVRAAKVSFGNDATVEPYGWLQGVELQCGYRDQPIPTEKQAALIKYLVRGMPSDEYQKMILNIADGGDVRALLWKFRNTPIHAAPFGHCFLSFIIEAPVFVARQLVKHEYLRMSEVSRRYIKGAPVYFKPDNWLSVVKDIKQGAGDPLPDESQEDTNLMWHHAVSTADRAYHAMMREGVAPEDARMVLPLCHMTRWYWSGSLDAFMNMCKMRLDGHAQSHTRIVAEQVGKHIKEAFPQSWASYVEGDI